MSITSVFTNGGSQAVRIPKKFRFSTDRVSVLPMKGGLLILPVAKKPTLEEFFAKCDELDADEREFLSVCRRGDKPQRKAVFGWRQAHMPTSGRALKNRGSQ